MAWWIRHLFKDWLLEYGLPPGVRKTHSLRADDMDNDVVSQILFQLLKPIFLILEGGEKRMI